MKNVVSPYLLALVKVIIVFFAPIKGIILLVALSTILDTCFGFWKAKHLKQKITSKIWRHGFVPKVLSYVVAVMLVYTSDYFILNELMKLILSIEFLSTKLIALALISIEVKSMDESFVKVKGWSFLEKITDYIMKAKDIKKQIND
jgi:peptidoglycan biosynthesis protein MviN/MurJ (putative lipid II flippase)